MSGYVIGVLAFSFSALIVVCGSLGVVFRRQILEYYEQYLSERTWGRVSGDREIIFASHYNFSNNFPSAVFVQNPSVRDMLSKAPALPELQEHEFVLAWEQSDIEVRPINSYRPAPSVWTEYEQVQATYENLMQRIAIPRSHAGALG